MITITMFSRNGYVYVEKTPKRTATESGLQDHLNHNSNSRPSEEKNHEQNDMNDEEIISELAKKSNGKDIFPKLSSHIEKHMKTWKEFGRNSALQKSASTSIKALRA